jgi:hypothetical protein
MTGLDVTTGKEVTAAVDLVNRIVDPTLVEAVTLASKCFPTWMFVRDIVALAPDIGEQLASKSEDSLAIALLQTNHW